MATELRHEDLNVEIQVGKETWIIGSDRYNFILGRKVFRKGRKKKPDQYEWDANTTTFYGSLESVLKNAQKLMIKNTNIKTFEELQATINNTGNHLLGIYEGLTNEDFKK